MYSSFAKLNIIALLITAVTAAFVASAADNVLLLAWS